MNDIPPDARALGRTALDPAALKAAALNAPGVDLDDLGAGTADDEASPAAMSGGSPDYPLNLSNQGTTNERASTRRLPSHRWACE